MLLVATMALGLSACDGSEAEETQEDSGKEKITIAIGNEYAPFCYMDEDEEPAGYEADLLNEVAEKLSDKYDIEIVCDTWDNIFIGLESGKYDIISHHMAYNADRAEKYNVSTESMMYYGNYRVLYKAGRTDITDIESLDGLTLSNIEGDNIGAILNKYLPDNTIVFQETDPSVDAVVAGIESGLYDAHVHTYFDLQAKFLDNYPDADIEMGTVDLIEDEDFDCGTYALLAKGNDALQADFDAALKEIREDGTMSELCIEWFGVDYSVQPE